jgi:ATP-binding cassette, subfamily B, bacterial MsbA
MIRKAWDKYYLSNKESVDTFFRLIAYFKRYKFWMALAILCALVVSAMTALTAYLLDPVMNKIFVDLKTDFLKVIAVAIVAIFFVKGLFRFLQNYILRSIGERVIRRMRGQLYSHYQYLDASYFTETHVGVMMSRITNDVNMMQRAVPSLVSLFREPITMVMLAVVAFYEFWQAALVVFVIFPLTAFPIAHFGKRLRKWVKRGQERMGELNTILKETFSGVRVIKAFGMEEYEIKRFRKENQQVFDANMKTVVFDELSSPVIEAIGSVAGACVVLVGGMMVIRGTITTGAFFAFLASLGMMYEPLKKISKMYMNFNAALAASVRVFDVLKTKNKIIDRPGGVEMRGVEKEIRFDNVVFSYGENDAEPVLKGVEFTAQVGQVVAIVGSSGSGKTTLVNLLPRFWDVRDGSILVDGVDIRDMKLVSLRSHIGIVTQEVFLFDDTVFANIAYGDENADSARVEQCAIDANAHTFIQQMPKGYETSIGELGVRLSGGQRQRLAIARALYKDAPILILDEATSSLDTESEREVQMALERLLTGRTSFVIAHRLSTIQKADRILVLKDGQIVEDGRHDDLLAQGGEYAYLYGLQFDGSPESEG